VCATALAYLYALKSEPQGIAPLRLTSAEAKARRAMREVFGRAAGIEKQWRGFRHVVFSPSSRALELTWQVSPASFACAFPRHEGGLDRTALYPAASIAFCRGPGDPHDPDGRALLVETVLHEEVHLVTQLGRRGEWGSGLIGANELAATIVGQSARIWIIEEEEPVAAYLDQFFDAGSDAEAFVRLFARETPASVIAGRALRIACAGTRSEARRRSLPLFAGDRDQADAWLSSLQGPGGRESVIADGRQEREEASEALSRCSEEELPEEGQGQVGQGAAA
jgi:hypothetical protein